MHVPKAIWETASAYALQIDIPTDKALTIILRTFAGLIAAGDTEFLGPQLHEAAKRARADNFGLLDDTPKIDLEKLHRNDKNKSGYHGVYANGKGFRAMGRTKTSSVQVYLGQFETAEAAAWHRYLHYKREGLPYGALELEVTRYRSEFKLTGSDEEVIAMIREDADRLGYTAEMFPEEIAKPLQCVYCAKSIDPNVDILADTARGSAHNGCAINGARSSR